MGRFKHHETNNNKNMKMNGGHLGLNLETFVTIH